EFTRPCFDASDRAAANRVSGLKGNQERSLAVGDFVRVEAKMARTFFRIATGELGVEGFDKSSRRWRQDIEALDDQTVLICWIAHDLKDLNTSSKASARL